jgi:hypothetical protein
LPPAKPAVRSDIAVEVDGVLDENGRLTGEWIESDGFDSVRLLYSFQRIQPSVGFEEALSAAESAVILPRPVQYRNGSTTALTGRYFRLVVDDGEPGTVFRASVRRAS